MVMPIPKFASKVPMLILPVPSVPLSVRVRQVTLMQWLPNARASPDKTVMLRPVPFALTNRGPIHSLRPVRRRPQLSLPNVPVGPLTTLRVPSMVMPIPKFASKVPMLILPVPSVPLSVLVRQVTLIKWLPNARASPDKTVMLRPAPFALTNRGPIHSLRPVLREQLSLPNVPVGPLTTVKVPSPVTPTVRSAPKVPMLILPVLSLSLRVRPVQLMQWLPNARASTVKVVMLRPVPFALTNRGPIHSLRPVRRRPRLSLPNV